MKTNHKILDEFLFYHLYNSDLKKILYTLGGGLRQTLRFDELKKFPVPFTTLEEQKEIVVEKQQSVENAKQNLLRNLNEEIKKIKSNGKLNKEAKKELIKNLLQNGL